MSAVKWILLGVIFLPGPEVKGQIGPIVKTNYGDIQGIQRSVNGKFK